ncbi:MAG: hypothetical protein ACOWYE_01495 [Desulfatiglandales bacterium]
MDLKTLASLGRSKDIVTILMKYGFDDLVDRFDMPGIGLLTKIHKAGQGLGTFERIRCALEDLGSGFVKLGQIMSLRPDLLPPQLIHELSKLPPQILRRTLVFSMWRLQDDTKSLKEQRQQRIGLGSLP